MGLGDNTLRPMHQSDASTKKVLDLGQDGAGRMRLLRDIEVCRLLTVARSTLARWVANPELDFPKPVPLGPGRKAFIEAEILAWIASRRRPDTPKAASAK